MKPSPPFNVALQIPASLVGRIVTDRVACRRHTRILEERSHDARAPKEKLQYQRKILNVLVAACARIEPFKQRDDATKLVRKFVTLAQTLESSKAVAFSFGQTEGVEVGSSPIEEEAASRDSSPELLSSPLELPASKPVREDILHPLSVALLAFRLGGPVNAAFTTHQNEWTLQKDAAHDAPSFYCEGDVGGMFEDLRVTVVWETRDEKESGPSGTHSVFLTGDATPRPLISLKRQEQDEGNSPTIILYDCKHAALYYDCNDPEAIRKSISLDFHRNTISDEDIRLLHGVSIDKSGEKPSLTELVTNFPIEGYAVHFHRILFNSVSLDAILTKLDMFEIPPAPALPKNGQRLREERFDVYKKDNWSHLPQDVKRMETDVYLQGVYTTQASFLGKILLKARRDVHLPVGANLFPQSPLEGNLEWARKFVRDLPDDLMSSRLDYYASALVGQTYTAKDLVSTANLHNYAKMLERRCLELIGIGLVDDACRLPSMAALACVFGSAIDGSKEGQIVAEPWIEELDLQVYRTRCLYLFWCADWLVCYLVKPEAGPFMIIDEDVAIAGAQGAEREVRRIATVLLRNWVAWSLFVERLPQGVFFVRRP
jgi:hypothetical protein